MRILEGHTAAVRCLAYSSDAALLATGGEDCRIYVRDRATGEVLRELIVHTDWVRAVCFSADAADLASAGWDDRACLSPARVKRGRTEPRELRGHPGGVWSLSWSVRGRRMATGGGDGGIHVFEGRPGSRRPRHIAAHTGPVAALAFDPEGGTLYSASHDGTLCAIRMGPGDERESYPMGLGWLRAMSLSADGRLLALSGDAPEIRVCATADIGEALTLVGHEGHVGGLAFIDAGRTLLSVGLDGTARRWDVASGTCREAYQWGVGPMRCLAVSPDGMTAAAGCADGRVIVWDVE